VTPTAKAAYTVSVKVKTMHEFMTGLEPGDDGPKPGHRILAVNLLLELSRHLRSTGLRRTN
jgi:hypothetical protein